MKAMTNASKPEHSICLSPGRSMIEQSIQKAFRKHVSLQEADQGLQEQLLPPHPRSVAGEEVHGEPSTASGNELGSLSGLQTTVEASTVDHGDGDYVPGDSGLEEEDEDEQDAEDADEEELMLPEVCIERHFLRLEYEFALRGALALLFSHAMSPRVQDSNIWGRVGKCLAIHADVDYQHCLFVMVGMYLGS
jgi:hypothetical protein